MYIYIAPCFFHGFKEFLYLLIIIMLHVFYSLGRSVVMYLNHLYIKIGLVYHEYIKLYKTLYGITAHEALKSKILIFYFGHHLHGFRYTIYSNHPVQSCFSTSYQAQIAMLMHGHDLYGHLDGTNPDPAPSRTTTQNNLEIKNPPQYTSYGCGNEILLPYLITERF